MREGVAWIWASILVCENEDSPPVNQKMLLAQINVSKPSLIFTIMLSTITAKIITKNNSLQNHFRGNHFCNYYKALCIQLDRTRKRAQKHYKNNCFRELFCNHVGHVVYSEFSEKCDSCLETLGKQVCVCVCVSG